MIRLDKVSRDPTSVGPDSEQKQAGPEPPGCARFTAHPAAPAGDEAGNPTRTGSVHHAEQRRGEGGGSHPPPPDPPSAQLAAPAQTNGPHLSQIRRINNIQMPTTTARMQGEIPPTRS